MKRVGKNERSTDVALRHDKQTESRPRLPIALMLLGSSLMALEGP